mmetsp:Transcript_42304/g.40525  ORF Transcript_42304/g.40525 Transcript_42304/m.40525 type:complete len:157 (-) Transcript_42304:78-548(-)
MVLLIQTLTEYNQNLTQLELSKIRFWDAFHKDLSKEDRSAWFLKLAQAINGLKALKQLDISGNENCQELFKFILEGTYTLKSLAMNDCYLHDIDMHYLQESFLSCRSLEGLSLRANKLKQESGMILGTILMKRPKLLTSLDLTNNELGEDGFQHII